MRFLETAVRIALATAAALAIAFAACAVAFFAFSIADSASRAVAAQPQNPTGFKLVIPAAGVNADINGVYMDSFKMPDPENETDVLAYDMSGLTTKGLGGDQNGGNLVISGWSICKDCLGILPVFNRLTELTTGDTAILKLDDGREVGYRVIRTEVVSERTDWNKLVASNTADMTLIACDVRNRTNRYIVQLRRT